MSATRIVVLVLGLLLSSLASANVEKVIFLGPEPVPEPQLSFNGPQLRLETLSPQKTSLQQTLLARFPATTDPRTLSETWILLDNLRKDQRYEVRICWSATVGNHPSLAAFCRRYFVLIALALRWLASGPV